MYRKLKEIHAILTLNRLRRTRLYEIGIIKKDFCLYYGLTGIISRPAKILIDARFTGYEGYSLIHFVIYLSYIGDSLDRYNLRLNEIIESCRIVYQIFCGSVKLIDAR